MVSALHNTATKLRDTYIEFCVRQEEIRNGTTPPRADGGTNEGKERGLTEPTVYLPGTRQKIKLMGDRYSAGLPLFFPGDARMMP